MPIHVSFAFIPPIQKGIGKRSNSKTSKHFTNVVPIKLFPEFIQKSSTPIHKGSGKRWNTMKSHFSDQKNLCHTSSAWLAGAISLVCPNSVRQWQKTKPCKIQKNNKNMLEWLLNFTEFFPHRQSPWFSQGFLFENLFFLYPVFRLLSYTNITSYKTNM